MTEICVVNSPSLLKDVKIWKRFELVGIGVPHFRGHFKDMVLIACDEVCGKKRGGEV